MAAEPWQSIAMVECRWLQPFSNVSDATRVEVEVARRSPAVLALRYVVHGVKGLRVPALAERRRVDELWRTTCLEVFIRTADGGYYEVNLSPSSEWAAYRFDGYREGMRDAAVIPEIRVNRTGDRLALLAQITLPEDAVGPLALSAVLEHGSGEQSYWALAHGADKPDFHHPDSFALELPAPEQP
jgi:hypothetical protein